MPRSKNMNPPVPEGDFPDILGSPSAGPAAIKSGNKNKMHQQPHIIDLSDKVLEDEDALLDELLDDGSYHDGGGSMTQKYNASVGTSRTVESDLTPGSPMSPLTPTDPYQRPRWNHMEEDANIIRETLAYPGHDHDHDDAQEEEGGVIEGQEEEEEEEAVEEEEEEETDEDDSDGSVSSMESEETATLLERAHDRLHLQDLHDEIEMLKGTIDQKNRELENMSGQLRRAVSTKCDLVLAHNELEMHHEQNLRRRDDGLTQLKKANLGLVEAQSEVEKDLLNEIVQLTEKIKIMEQNHRIKIDEWDQIHKNEIAEKDFKIAALQEELRKVKYGKSKSTTNNSSSMMQIPTLFKR